MTGEALDGGPAEHLASPAVQWGCDCGAVGGAVLGEIGTHWEAAAEKFVGAFVALEPDS